MNGVIWFFYSLLLKDIYVCIPQVVCIVSAIINFNLYQWTKGKLDNSNWFILWLHSKFNAKGPKALKVIANEIKGELKLSKKIKEEERCIKKER